MRTVFTVAAGLVATASAANLRSDASMKEAAARATIAALAEKYDCKTGGKNLEDIFDEIGEKNTVTGVTLEKSCKASFESYNTALVAAQDKVSNQRLSATPNAEAHFQKKVSEAKGGYAKLNSAHADTVTSAESKSDQMQGEFDAQTIKFNAETNAYEAEKLLLVSDRATAQSNYKNAMEKAAENLRVGLSDEDKIRNDKITAANGVKVADDKACQGTYQSRQAIIANDQTIVNQLKQLSDELASLETRQAPGATFLEIREKVHANYDALLDEKKKEIDGWNQQCNDNRKSYDDELAEENTAAAAIRDTTVARHGAVFDASKGAADSELDVIVKRNDASVTEKKSTNFVNQKDYNEKHKDYEEKKAAHSEKLSKLRPAFGPEGTVTAGNASGVNDGACALLLAGA